MQRETPQFCDPADDGRRFTDQDETVLTGAVVDQAGLYGLIARLRDLGLPLLSVNAGEINPESVPQ